VNVELGKEDGMNVSTNAKLCDVGNLILGATLILAPWMFTFAAGIQSENMIASGIVVMLLSIAALVGFAAWEEWGNMIAGFWLIASPWVLYFQETEATRLQVTIGIIVAAFAKNELWFRSTQKSTNGIT
jgi:SPW repeat